MEAIRVVDRQKQSRKSNQVFIYALYLGILHIFFSRSPSKNNDFNKEITVYGRFFSNRIIFNLNNIHIAIFIIRSLILPGLFPFKNFYPNADLVSAPFADATISSTRLSLTSVVRYCYNLHYKKMQPGVWSDRPNKTGITA